MLIGLLCSSSFWSSRLVRLRLGYHRVMNHLFWLIPNRLCGRCGPGQQPWDYAALRESGIGAILSVSGGLVEPAEVQAAGLDHACIEMSANAPPLEGDAEVCRAALPKALSYVEDQMGRGHAVLVHCAAGKDRTGLFLSYYLARREGLSARAAITRLRQVRPIALSAEGWEDFALELIDAMCPGR